MAFWVTVSNSEGKASPGVVMPGKYRDKATERFANGEFVKAFSGFAMQAQAKLDALDAAPNVAAHRAIRGHRLEALNGDRVGQYSIRINDQYRLCFDWPDGAERPFMDYH